MGYGTSTTEREQYVSELAGLWEGLSSALARLETASSDAQTLEHAGDMLPSLQYGLHRSSELVQGIVPPPGSETAHADLAAALEQARDATGEIRDVLQAEGADVAYLLVHEWRGALFGVRLARQRLALSPQPEPVLVEPDPDFNWSAAIATALVLGGTAAFVVGAVAVLWPVWVLGLALVAASFVIFR